MPSQLCWGPCAVQALPRALCSLAVSLLDAPCCHPLFPSEITPVARFGSDSNVLSLSGSAKLIRSSNQPLPLLALSKVPHSSLEPPSLGILPELVVSSYSFCAHLIPLHWQLPEGNGLPVIFHLGLVQNMQQWLTEPVFC